MAEVPLDLQHQPARAQFRAIGMPAQHLTCKRIHATRRLARTDRPEDGRASVEAAPLHGQPARLLAGARLGATVRLPDDDLGLFTLRPQRKRRHRRLSAPPLHQQPAHGRAEQYQEIRCQDPSRGISPAQHFGGDWRLDTDQRQYRIVRRPRPIPTPHHRTQNSTRDCQQQSQRHRSRSLRKTLQAQRVADPKAYLQAASAAL